MKKSWKMFLPLVICLALCMSLFTVSASAASTSTPGTVEQKDGKWVAVDKKGNEIKNGWVGETYKDENGKTQKAWYYVSKGEVVQGWQNVDGNWYFFADTGRGAGPEMYSNSAKNGPLYLFDESNPNPESYKTADKFNAAKNAWWFNADGTVGGNSGWVSTVVVDKTEKPTRIWFYVNSDGTLAKGFKDDAGNWYELADLAMLLTGTADEYNTTIYPNGWIDIRNGKEEWAKMPKYWVNPNGTMVVSDWASAMGEDGDGQPHRYWFFADENGELVQGWNNIDGVWYYFGYPDPNTEKPYADYYVMQENQNIEMDGNVYRVGKLGALVTGWAEDLDNDGEWNYFDPATGAQVQDQWKQIDGKWYYFEGADVLHEGQFEYDGDLYYAGKDGAMVTGWIQDQTDGGWYNYGTDGVMQTGWIEDGGNWYYLDENGVAAQNEWVDGEYLGSDGAWIPETPGN